ncbi:hypothetical protein QBC32DRAFT_346050 [Pseudoneurospora amorphoporcata]|uniref:DUF7907 domain-containing protein n=1 Tax=Pseudoneurospora amorphoporcata TaxID=241081 RepID=A0AAN6NT42_9PEZI|nr:hypothetical protein QBC32DRAFT_346050 [Pseudoneurospora amorphoporcata]
MARNLFLDDINHWSLRGVHVGAGQSTAVLAKPNITASGPSNMAERSSSSGPHQIYYQNSTGGISLDNSNPFPLSIRLGGTYDSDFPSILYLGIFFGLSTPSISVSFQPPGHPRLYISSAGADSPEADEPTAPGSPVTDNEAPELYRQGTFIVCNETDPVYTRPQYPVRFAKSNGDGTVNLPSNCASIELLAQCGTLSYLDGQGMEYGQDRPGVVGCFDGGLRGSARGNER